VDRLFLPKAPFFVAKEGDTNLDQVDSADVPALQNHCSGHDLGKNGTCTFELHFTTLDADPGDLQKPDPGDIGMWTIGVGATWVETGHFLKTISFGQATVRVADDVVAPEPSTWTEAGIGAVLLVGSRLRARGGRQARP
jgi:hypothetical protein